MLANDKKRLFGLSCVLIVIIVAFLGLNWLILENKKTSIEDADEAFGKYCFQLDEVSYYDGAFLINGWAIDILNDNRIIGNEGNLVLQNINDKSDKFAVEISACEKKDVAEYFGINNCKIGINGVIASDKIDEQSMYEIYLKPDCRYDYSVKTDCYICNGELFYTKKIKEVQSELDAFASKNGIGKIVVRKVIDTKNIIIAQVGWKVIVFSLKQSGNFNENSFVQFIVETNQNGMLPEYRRQMGVNTDSIGDYVYNLSKDIENNDSERYDVLLFDLPEKYPITSVLIGCNSDAEEWNWKTYFRPIIKGE